MSTPYSDIYRDPFEDRVVADQRKMATKAISDSLVQLENNALERNRDTVHEAVGRISDPDVLELLVNFEKSSRMLSIADSNAAAFQKQYIGNDGISSADSLHLATRMNYVISHGERFASLEAQSAQYDFENSDLVRSVNKALVVSASNMLLNDTILKRQKGAATFLMAEIAAGNPQAVNLVSSEIIKGYNRGMSQTEAMGRLLDRVSTDNDLFHQIRKSGVEARSGGRSPEGYTVHNVDELSQEAFKSFREDYRVLADRSSEEYLKDRPKLYTLGLVAALDENKSLLGRQVDLGPIQSADDFFKHLAHELKDNPRSPAVLNEKIAVLGKTYENFLSNAARAEILAEKEKVFDPFKNIILGRARTEREHLDPGFNVRVESVKTGIEQSFATKDPFMLRVYSVLPKENRVEVLNLASLMRANEMEFDKKHQPQRSRESGFSR